MKRIILIAISTIILMFLIIPTAANAVEERKDYSVTILPGNGSIKESPDECTKDGYYVRCNKEEFKDICSINITVRENENIKNRIDYAYKSEGFSEVHKWANEGYITDTKIVNFILKNGIDTLDYRKSEFGNLAYSTECEKVYLFVPPENMSFSHFIDQDGNIFNINDTVTKNLTLTPIYTENEVESVFMNYKIYDVTFLKGEGQIYYKAESRYDNASDGNVDEIRFQAYDGKNNFYDISDSYSKFRYSDYEKGIEVLKSGKEEVLKRIEEGNIDEAKEYFNNLIDYAFNELFFTECLNFTVDESDPSSKYFRENAMSFGMLLTIWVDSFGEGDCSAENLSEVLDNMNRFDELTEEEKQNAIDRLVITMNAFEKVWDEYTYTDIFKPIEYNLYSEDYIKYKLYGATYNNLIYSGEDTTSSDDSYFFIPPTIDYELSHFVDQDGEVFKLGDPITKDMVLTPIYVDSYKSEENSITINVETEDNSNEEFEIDVYREADKLIYNDLNDKSNYTFNEEDWTIDENGTIISFDVDPSKIEEKYKKITKTIHIPGSEAIEEQDITLETGLMAIGIPEKIDGITVKGISSDAFLNFKNKYIEQNQNSNVEASYFENNWMSIYVPKTLETFGNSDWTKSYFFDGINIKEELEEQKSKLKEEGYSLICIDCLEGIEEGTGICPQCGGTIITDIETLDVEVTTDGDKDIVLPPTIYMPTTYIIVDSDSENYTAIHGSLYSKDVSKLYYLSFLSQMQSLSLGNWYGYEPIWDSFHNIISGIEGLEIPSTVEESALFAINSPYGEMAMHYYGNGFVFEEGNLPTKMSVTFLYGDGQKQTYYEEEPDANVLKIGMLCQRFAYIINKQDIPMVNSLCDVFGITEFKWVLNESGIYSNLAVADDEYLPVICLSNENRGKINTSGIVSKDKPFEVYIYNKGIFENEELVWMGLKDGDPFVRTIRFRNLPDRYIKPSADELNFSLDDKEQGVTIKLMLKKGKVSVKTIDTDGNNISGTYNIIDEGENIVGTIRTYEDGHIEMSDELVYGKYKVVATEIQEGYIKPEEQSFEIKENEQVIELQFEAVKEEKPQPEEPEPDNPVPESPEPEEPKPDNPVPESPEPEESKPDNPAPESPKKEEPKVEQENQATGAMPYTGTTIRILIIIAGVAGLGLMICIGVKVYKNV